MPDPTPDIVVVGAGPSGLIAAEVLADHGLMVAVFDQMPSPARKLLMAGRGGLNLTHSEGRDAFLRRYQPLAPQLAQALDLFPPAQLAAWAEGLGINLFQGSSGRIFPTQMKASPLLRAWLRRLEERSVRLFARHDWIGWDDGHVTLRRNGGEAVTLKPRATLLALGGASWPRLGSDGRWTAHLQSLGAPVTPLSPANAGVRIGWSDYFAQHFAGQPLKNVAVSVGEETFRGEAMISSYGLEGGVVYAAGAALHSALTGGGATITLDLRPDMPMAALMQALKQRRAGASLSTVLAKQARLSKAAIALLREPGALPSDSGALARRIKAVSLPVEGFTGLERAISTRGGLAFAALDEQFMLRDLPGLFAAGEMLDWEAPTGGYLLQGCFATGYAAAYGILSWLGLDSKPPKPERFEAGVLPLNRRS